MTLGQEIAVTLLAGFGCLVAIALLIKDRLKPGRKGETVQGEYGTWERLHDIKDQTPF